MLSHRNFPFYFLPRWAFNVDSLWQASYVLLTTPDSKVHGANLGPPLGPTGPRWAPHVGPWTLLSGRVLNCSREPDRPESPLALAATEQAQWLRLPAPSLPICFDGIIRLSSDQSFAGLPSYLSPQLEYSGRQTAIFSCWLGQCAPLLEQRDFVPSCWTNYRSTNSTT